MRFHLKSQQKSDMDGPYSFLFCKWHESPPQQPIVNMYSMAIYDMLYM